MKSANVKQLLKSKKVMGSFTALAVAVVIGGTAFFQGVNQVPEFPQIMEPIMVASIEDEDVPLAAAPKVTTSTSSKTTTKNVKLSTAATKTYTKKLATTTKTTTKTSTTSSSKVTTETTTKTETTEKYTKKSKTKAVTTKVTTTVKKTTVPKATPTPTKKPVQKYTTTIDQLAPKMDDKVKKCFNDLGFYIIVDPNVSYSGYFDARNQTITMNAKQIDTFADVVYHEIGHFIAFIAGNVDTKPAFASIYTAEKSKLTGVNKSYAAQNASEFFAECVRVYIVDPAGLKKNCPKTYAEIEKAIASFSDSRTSMFKTVYGAYWKF